jgi:branched-chain amino acid aminotransferase
MAEWSRTWTFIDGDWHEGNPPVIGPRSHAIWLGSSVFDGARAFEGVTPDLDRHCARVNASARALGLEPTVQAETIFGLAREGVGKFAAEAALYIRPMYWAEQGGYMSVPPDPASTRFLLTIYETPMPPPTGFSVTVSPFRRPSLETMPTDSKAGCLYPNNGRAIMEAKRRGFDNALVRDMLGNVAETGTSNIFMVKDGVVMTPAPNGSFLNGITRQRVIDLLRASGVEVRGNGAGRRGLPRCRRDFLDRQLLQGNPGYPDRGPRPATRSGAQQGPPSILGVGAFLTRAGPRNRKGTARSLAAQREDSMHSKTFWFAAILTVLGGPAQAALFESFFNHQADRPPVAGSRPEIAAAAGSEGTWFGRFSGQRFDSFVDSYKPFSARGCFKSELAV